MIHVQQFLVRPDKAEATVLFGSSLERADLVLVFGSPDYISSAAFHDSMREFFNQAVIAGGSVVSQCGMGHAWQDAVLVTAVQFSTTLVKSASISLEEFPDRQEAGRALREGFSVQGVGHVFLFSDDDAPGMREFLIGFNGSGKLPISGTLMGRQAGGNLIVDNQGAEPDLVLAVGLYGENVEVSWDATTGWQGLASTHEARAEGNLLRELDGLPALDVYEEMLGREAADLPDAAVYHPFQSVADRSPGDLRVPRATDSGSRSLRFQDHAPSGLVKRLVLTEPQDLMEEAVQMATKARATLAESGFFITGGDHLRKDALGPLWQMEVARMTEKLGRDFCSAGFHAGTAFSMMDGDLRFHEEAAWVSTIREK